MCYFLCGDGHRAAKYKKRLGSFFHSSMALAAASKEASLADFSSGQPQDDFNAATCSSQQTGEAVAAIAADPAGNAPSQRQSVIAAGGVGPASLVMQVFSSISDRPTALNSRQVMGSPLDCGKISTTERAN
jgi:hypothetical protein